MRRAVITGATGMLGLALTRLLVLEGIEVLAVARPGSGRILNIPADERVRVVECGLENIEELPGIIGVKCDMFFHFAWAGTFGDSRNDMELQTCNIAYSVRAAEAAAKLGCGVFLGAGSQAEYVRNTLRPRRIPRSPKTATEWRSCAQVR